MDPKQTAQLDPKLKEAYDRVMGTATASTPGSPASTPAMPTAAPTTQVAPVTPISASPTPAAVTTPPTESSTANPLPVAPVVMPHSAETVKIGGGSPAPDTSAPTPTSATQGVKKGISPVIIIGGGIVFLIAYTLFWVKFLNIPLPFLGQ